MTAQVQAYFTDLYGRLLDPEWLEPLREAPDSGYELLRASAEVAARLDLAVERLDTGSFILDAAGPQHAEATVEFYRPAGALPAVTVKAGSVVSTSYRDRRFTLLEDAVFAPGGLVSAPARLVRAQAPGYEWNVMGPRTAGDGTNLPGDIDLPLKLVLDPPFGDPSVQVRQVTDASGGRPDSLGQLGGERDILRESGEGDVSYRARIRLLPDTVSPDALQRVVDQVLAPILIVGVVVEAWQVTPLVDDGDAGLFFDDPRPNGTHNMDLPGRLLDEDFERAAFFVVLPTLPTLGETGFFFDDPAINNAERTNPSGGTRRAAFFDPPSPSLDGFLDGVDLRREAVYNGLVQVLNRTKAGGVKYLLVLE